MVQLTPEQSEALRSASGQPLAIVDPKTQQTFFIVTSQDVDELNELRNEDHAMSAFSAASLHDSLKRVEANPDVPRIAGESRPGTP
ncbi:MAG: hypothetical protein SH850_12310 [Planctomycetaceae bacterium]|nr:hypothetical protein [Planctomycetaceae bacterium]